MTSRLLPFLVVVAALAAACAGAPAGQCSPNTCGGCCSATGVCEPGITERACGGAGNQCLECPVGNACVAGACQPKACTPATCASLGATCGDVPDGCGSTVSCGGCAQGESCGAGGRPNVCGTGTCTPTTCAQAGKNCGTISDGCSTTLDCGGCTTGTCGGGGMPNVCGMTSAAGGGSASGGGSATCQCPQGYTCQAGLCTGGNAETLSLDVMAPAVISIGGTIQYNGAPATIRSASATCGRLKLTSVDGKFSNEVPLSCNSGTNVTFQGRVVAGQYRAELLDADTYLVVPETMLTTGPIDLSTSKLNLAVGFTGPAAVHFTGTVLKNGLKPQVLIPGRCGTLSFSEPGSSTTRSFYVFLNCTTAGDVTFEGDAFAQAYDLRLNGYLSATDFSDHAQPRVTLSPGMAPMRLNVQAGARIELSGTITLNGKSPTLFPGGFRPSIELKSVGGTGVSETFYPPQGASTFVMPALAGTYDVILNGTLSNSQRFSRTLYPARSITTSQTLNLDTALSTTPITLQVTHNGAVVNHPNCYYARFTSPTNGTASMFCPKAPGTTSQALIPGTYMVTIDGTQGTGIPHSDLSLWGWPAGTITVPVSTTAASFNVALTTPGESTLAGFSVLHNGAAPVVFSPNSQTCGSVWLESTTSTYKTSAPFSCSTGSGFQVSNLLVTRGTYKVSVQGDQRSSSLPNTPKVVIPALVVSTDQPSKVLDVKTPPMAKVSGRVMFNGQSPLVLKTVTDCGEAIFENTNGVDHQKVPLQCSNAGQITFEGLVISGTYRVLVRGDADEVVLPPSPVQVISAVSVP